MLRILVMHGPNLNWLGRREPDVYGPMTLDEIQRDLDDAAVRLGVEMRSLQSNHEGVLIDKLQEAASASASGADGVLFNPGALAHYSFALADAIRSIQPIPVIEIHLSNTSAREEFRKKTVVGAACMARIEGWGARSYLLGLEGLVAHLRSAFPADRDRC